MNMKKLVPSGGAHDEMLIISFLGSWFSRKKPPHWVPTSKPVSFLTFVGPMQAFLFPIFASTTEGMCSPPFAKGNGVQK